MEIRNNPTTQIAMKSNQTSFGMAMLKPKDVKNFVQETGTFRTGLTGFIRRRGVRQVVKELEGVKNYDVEHIPSNKKTFRVLNSNGEIEATYNTDSPNLIKTSIDKINEKLENVSAKTGLGLLLKEIGLFFRGIYNLTKMITINPKESLPRTLLTAVEKAKELDKAHIKAQKLKAAEEKARMIAEKKEKQLMNKAIDYIEKSFETK